MPITPHFPGGYRIFAGFCFPGGYGSGFSLCRDYWRWALGQISAEELAGGRASTKSLYCNPPTRKVKAKSNGRNDKAMWLWFEDADETAHAISNKSPLYRE